jgi:hypothetical protein
MVGSRWSGMSRVLEPLYERKGVGVGGKLEYTSLRQCLSVDFAAEVLILPQAGPIPNLYVCLQGHGAFIPFDRPNH